MNPKPEPAREFDMSDFTPLPAVPALTAAESFIAANVRRGSGGLVDGRPKNHDLVALARQMMVLDQFWPVYAHAIRFICDPAVAEGLRKIIARRLANLTVEIDPRLDKSAAVPGRHVPPLHDSTPTIILCHARN